MTEDISKIQTMLTDKIKQEIPLHTVYFNYIEGVDSNKHLLSDETYQRIVEMLCELFIGVIHSTNILITKSENTSLGSSVYYVKGINDPKYINNYYAQNAILWDLFERVNVGGERAQEIAMQMTLLKTTFRRQLDYAKKPTSNPSCYVATMAYQDINHPQVEYLRQVRDEKLLHYYLGQIFVKYYYKYSPILVKRLERRQAINRSIRKGLDSLIYILKKSINSKKI